MVARVAMILGRSLFIRDSSGWQCEQFQSGSDSNQRALTRLGEIFSTDTKECIILVYEPEGMAHESVETPRVKRDVFASLARIRRDHPVVSSLNVGWGMEWPEPAAGGTYSTLLHSELSPGLIHVKDMYAQGRRKFSKVWSLYTVVEALLKVGSSAARLGHCVILAPGFAAVAICGIGRRSLRTWVGHMSERDWKVLWTMISESKDNSPGTATEANVERAGIFAIVERDPAQLCPFWCELMKSGRVRSVIGFDEIAETSRGLSENHPGNILMAFPKPLELNRYFLAASVLGFSVSTTMCMVSLGDVKRFEKTQLESQLRQSEQRKLLEGLEFNRREIASLRAEVPEEPNPLIADMHIELLELASIIPNSLLLQSVVMADDGNIEIEALAIAPSFDAERTRTAFADYGLIPDSARGWLYDAASGRLKIRGKYSGHQR